jgi:alpha-D-xyloside xylohydrolase
MLHARAFFDGMRAEGEEEVVSLCRSAWAGSQRYGAAVWSGDIDSTFEDLRRQIPAGLNIGLSGIPWWTTDIGGFKGGDITSPSFRELIVRWFQFGVFSPICRLHGVRQPGSMVGAEQTGAANEVWSFGEAEYGILRRLLLLRERLRPYVMDQMRAAQESGVPPMRPLFVNFPGDAASWEVEDQFLLGDDVLVAPVTTEGARERPVYLPNGTAWLDAWTGAELPGGQWVTAPAPLEIIPVFLRDGGRVQPFGPAESLGAPAGSSNAPGGPSSDRGGSPGGGIRPGGDAP